MKKRFFKILFILLCISTAIFVISCEAGNNPTTSEKESVISSESESESKGNPTHDCNFSITRASTTHHWYECACGNKKDEAPHVWTEESKELEEKVCSICDFHIGDYTGLDFKTLTADGKTAYGAVSNATEKFSFADEVKITGNAKLVVSLDEYGINTSATKVVPLGVGNNVIYLFVFVDEEIVDTYTVTIRRRPMYEVTFNTNGGSAVATQYVEEDFLATQPTTEKAGYDFVSWNYYFNEPITRDTVVTAQFEIKPEMSNFNFTSTATTCLITGLKDKTVTEIIVPDYVTSIGEKAFRDCDSLTSVVIGDGVTSIGYQAFDGCGSLTSVVIGDGVTTIGDGAFQECYRLTSVVIGDGVTSIGDSAFRNCNSLTSIVIPDNVTSIGKYAFQKCNSLASVVFPVSVTSIGGYAFDDCNSLTSIVIGDGVTSIGDRAFQECYRLTSVVIGNSVTTIGEDAFVGCYKLVEVINKSTHFTVTKGSTDCGYLGYYALAVYNSGSGITESQLLNDNGYIIYTDGAEKILVGYNGAETDLVLPSYITKINQNAFRYCDSLASVVIPDSVISIGDVAFGFCYSLTSITIPDSATSIGFYAFYACDSLTSVVIPDSVTSIGDWAFRDCDRLTSVVIGDGVTTIGKDAFSDCYSLISVVIPDSVTSIGDWAFYNCGSLTRVYYKGTASEWSGISIGSYNTSLTNATRYYYSETEPTASGRYWHYDEDGNVAVW